MKTNVDRGRSFLLKSTSTFTHSIHPLISTLTKTHPTERGREKVTFKATTRELTVLEGAAMVSISSWVTHTLPDGYEGQSPRDRAAAGWVAAVR